MHILRKINAYLEKPRYSLLKKAKGIFFFQSYLFILHFVYSVVGDSIRIALTHGRVQTSIFRIGKVFGLKKKQKNKNNNLSLISIFQFSVSQFPFDIQ